MPSPRAYAFAACALAASFSATAGEPGSKPYTVTVEAPPAKIGAAAKAAIEVKPSAGYHINKEFPTSLKLEATPGVDLPKRISKSDSGMRLAETGARIEVPFTAKEAGKKVIVGVLSFAVCTDTTCDPCKAPVQITVDVKQGLAPAAAPSPKAPVQIK